MYSYANDQDTYDQDTLIQDSNNLVLLLGKCPMMLLRLVRVVHLPTELVCLVKDGIFLVIFSL